MLKVLRAPRAAGPLGFIVLALLLSVCGPARAEVPSDGRMPLAEVAQHLLILGGTRAGDRLVVVGTHGHILLSDTNGASWRLVDCPVDRTLTSVAFADAKTGWITGYDATILKTIDGGESWQLVNEQTDGQDHILFSVAFDAAGHGVAVGAYNLLLRSTDGGAHWQAAPLHDTDTDYHLNDVIALGPDQFFIAAEAGNAFYSEDGGQNWSSRKPDYNGSLFGVLGLPGDGLFMFGLRGHAFMSADRGQSWRVIPTGTVSGLLGGAVLKDGRIVVAGNDGIALITDAGLTKFQPVAHLGRASLGTVVETADHKLVLGGEEGIQLVDLPPPDVAQAAPANQ